jgi:hypothetical protein
MAVHVAVARISKRLPNRVSVRPSLYFHCEAIMEDFIADEVESILHIAREISGMLYALPHDAPVRERSSIQDPTLEGERGSPCARVGRPFSTFMEGSYACCGEV